jgi:hypothetical protein
MRRSNPFRGRWRIVSTDIWEASDLDDLGPAQITFGRGRAGEMNLIAISATVDYRVGIREGTPIAEFSWEGDDDGHTISGRGWARLDGQDLIGRLFIHHGDEAEFIAKRVPAK